MSETFKTTTNREFKWPYPKPITLKPVQPKMITKEKGFYMTRPVAAYCHCDSHSYDPQLNQYKELAKKEKILMMELSKLNDKQVALSHGVLENPCDTDDDKMITICQTDYIKRGLQLPHYRKMMADVDSTAESPTKPPVIGLLQGYRDPTMFRYSALQRPTIDPCAPVTFRMTPEQVKEWFKPHTGRTEYQDTIDKNGLSIMKSSQQYKEPLPSTRRRFGDPCL